MAQSTKHRIEAIGINPTCGYALAGIPNNRAGRRFIEQLRTYVNPGMVGRVRVRPWQPKPGQKRAKVGTWRNAAYTAWGDLKTDQARTLRVYLDSPGRSGAPKLPIIATMEQQVRQLRADAQNAAATARTHDAARRELQRDLDGTMKGWEDTKERLDREVVAHEKTKAEREDLRWTSAIARLERDSARHDAREAQLRLNAIPAWVLGAVARAQCCSAWARAKMRHFVSVLRAHTADLIP